ncbi:hypothetical protein [Streptomyces sp. NPDC005507]|uniref:AfsR/SARP family transcriptional regulator n=1 Tax=Streptomyces sp. NPDC005507 TaxID=3154885 RepID=UPI0033A2ADF8
MSAAAAREAMDPRKPWSKATLQSRISELRNRLGTDTDGSPFLPRDRTGTYRLSPTARCDWTRFTQLAERGLAHGPDTGIADLEAALDLVRGRPFGGADLVWAAARIQEMLVRITDVAHTSRPGTATRRARIWQPRAVPSYAVSISTTVQKSCTRTGC